jgi:hypothetical protein
MRFDEKIRVDLPDEAARAQILAAQLSQRLWAPFAISRDASHTTASRNGFDGCALYRPCRRPWRRRATEIDRLQSRQAAAAVGLVNEMVEARQQGQLSRAVGRWLRYELIAIDEVGYVPLAEVGAELLFQVISERAEKAAVILTTNLPFSEWTQVFPNPRLCKALLDRVTDRAHIIETGAESYRFRRTLEGRQKRKN